MPEPVGNVGTEAEGMAAIGLGGEGSVEGEAGAAAAEDENLLSGEAGAEAGDPGAEAGEAKEGEDPEAKPEGEEGEAAAEAGAEDTVESLKERVAVLDKRQRDGDAYISKLTNEIAKHRANAISPRGNEAEQLSEADEIERRFPVEVEEIKKLRDDGKNIAAAVKESELASQITSDRNRAINEVRTEILTQTAEVLKLKDFPKYREQMSAILNNIPIQEIQDSPGPWTTLAYQASVGKSYIDAISKNVRKNPPGPISRSTGKGGIVSGKGNQPKSEADEAVEGMLSAGSTGTVFD